MRQSVAPSVFVVGVAGRGPGEMRAWAKHAMEIQGQVAAVLAMAGVEPGWVLTCMLPGGADVTLRGVVVEDTTNSLKIAGGT